MGSSQCDQILRTLPLWQKFTCVWQIFDGLFRIWKNAEPTLCKFVTLLG